ncbi:MAG: hypothetical protein WCF57_09335 [Pyrinomonadaceae bacterium]
MAVKKKSDVKTPDQEAGDMPDMNDLITLQEAAKIRGRTLSAITELVRRGRLRAYEKFGRKLLSRREVKTLEDKRGWPKGKPRKEEQEEGSKK